MSKENTLHIGTKIREVRKAKGFSQAELAQNILVDQSLLSKIETGTIDCPNELLRAIKKALDVEGLPMLEPERLNFKDKLHQWYDVISERDFVKAREMQKKLSVITFLHTDRELNIFYDLFHCRLLLGENDLEPAKEILDAFEINLNELNDIQLYHYYCNQGTWNIRSGLNSEALDFYLQAYELMKCGLEKCVTLYYNIAICYFRLGRVAQSTTYLEKARELGSGEQKNIPEFAIDNALARNYTQTSYLQGAKMLLDKCYTKALRDNNHENIGRVLLNYGFMYHVAKDWNNAIEHLDSALSYLEKGSLNYLEMLYQKIRCFIETECYSSCTRLLAEGKMLSKENELYSILFKSLAHLTTPNNDKSINYLETKTIPYLLDKKFNYTALDYCDVLRKYYKKKGIGFQTKAYKMAEIICNIREEILDGGVI